VSDRDGDAHPAQVPLQEQADEPGWQHHRELSASMFDCAKYRQRKGAIKLHLFLDHDGYRLSKMASTQK
jgi:hypothetical protein